MTRTIRMAVIGLVTLSLSVLVPTAFAEDKAKSDITDKIERMFINIGRSEWVNRLCQPLKCFPHSGLRTIYRIFPTQPGLPLETFVGDVKTVEGAWKQVEQKNGDSQEYQKLPDGTVMIDCIVGGRFIWTVVRTERLSASQAAAIRRRRTNLPRSSST